MPWSAHLTVEPVFEGGLAAYLLRGLLTQEEVAELVGVARQGMASHQEPRSRVHATVSLDKAPALNSSAGVSRLDKRLAVLSGLPRSHLEEGYFSIYNEGHELQTLHLDNHHALFSPRRLVSFVVYLVGEGEGLEGGGTVFPLAPPGSPKRWHLEDERVAAWGSALAGAAAFRLGEDPQGARVCPGSRRSGPPGDACRSAMDLARHICETSADEELDLSSGLVHARAGDAIMFYQLDQAGQETARAIHASCPVDAGTKVVLAKFVRGGPKPFTDEAAFTKARQHWTDARKQATAQEEL